MNIAVTGREGGSGSSGGILVLALWTLLFLAVIAAAVGARVSVHIALSRRMIERSSAHYAAMAGVFRAIDDIRRAEGPWRAPLPPGDERESAMRDVAAGEGVFSVYDVSVGEDGTVTTNYGPADETSRVNINIVTNAAGYAVVRSLLRRAGGLSADAAEETTACIADWIDADDRPGRFGAENEYYTALPKGYRCRNGPMASVWELALVKGVAPELFDRIERHVTVHGAKGAVNINTAGFVALCSLAGARKDADEAACERLARRIVDYRRASGALETPDKRELKRLLFRAEELDGAEQEEWVALEWLVNHHLVTVQTDMFHVTCIGSSGSGDRTAKRIVFVYDRNAGEIRAWNED